MGRKNRLATRVVVKKRTIPKMKTMKLNRKKMPQIRDVENLVIPEPEFYHLKNGIPVYDTNLGTQDVVKCELVFFAGRPFEKKKLASRATSAMLREGTKNYTSSEIAEIFDYYGGSLSMPVGMDTSSIQVYSLRKHFDMLLPVVAEMLTVPVFPEKELNAFIERNKRRLRIELSKNDVLAYRKFTELIFGEDHPYGYNSFPETYSALQGSDLEKHFEENFHTGNCMIFLSGNTGAPVRDMLEKHLGGGIRKGEINQAEFETPSRKPEKVRLSHENSVQKAIRIGAPLFNRKHEDYNGMYVLNTLLGGYFGSRLMHNVREDKGYTYNIYSTHDSLLYSGYFYVATEVGNDFVEQSVKEIYDEMEKLCNSPVEKEEMLMVKNYLLGNMLTNLDGAFNVSEVIKTFVTEGIELNAFEKLVADIKSITPEQVQVLAQKYFRRDSVWEVIV